LNCWFDSNADFHLQSLLQMEVSDALAMLTLHCNHSALFLLGEESFSLIRKGITN
jgi:hypothetical protein